MAPERSAPELNNNHAAMEKQVTTASSAMLATGRNADVPGRELALATRRALVCVLPPPVDYSGGDTGTCTA